jgi:hypothetical protein
MKADLDEGLRPPDLSQLNIPRARNPGALPANVPWLLAHALLRAASTLRSTPIGKVPKPRQRSSQRKPA